MPALTPRQALLLGFVVAPALFAVKRQALL